MKALRLVLVLGVAVPTLLLAAGWYRSAELERVGVSRAREAQLERTAAKVRAAVDESLEELRERESARPYYHFNYYFSPPEALALNDPVLVSPIASTPTDARVLGYFAIEPGGGVRTPHVAPGQNAQAPFVTELIARLHSDELAPLREESGDYRDNTIAESNDYVAEQAVNIQNAQTGDALANARIVEQGRQNPFKIALEKEPMRWQSMGAQLVLRRVVNDAAGVPVVQGVMLDREHLLSVWLPKILSRHGAEGATVLLADEEGVCGLRRPVSHSLAFAEICLAAPPAVTGTRHWQLGALFGLVGIVLAGAWTVHRASRRAEELAEQKSRFVTAVTHELRTPLTTLRMHAEMLRDGLVSEQRVPRVHRELADETVRLSGLIENVLELSRLEHGRARVERQSLDLADCVERAAEAQREKLEGVGLSLELELPDEAPFSADAVAVERIVANLLDNAFKYAVTEHGTDGGTVVRLSLDVTPETATLTVHDDGPGIAQANRERVFDRFFRAHSGTEAGTGIGLSLVRDIARAHGGDASLGAGEGCTVVVTLA